MIPNPLVNRFHLLLLAVMVAITLTGFVRIEAAAGLPVHWGLDGEPDQVWPRDPALLALPLIAVLLTGLFAVIGAFAPATQLEGGRSVLEITLAAVLGLLCALQFALLLIGIGSDIDMVRVLAFLVAVFIVVIGLALPRSRPNVYAGVRLPWTMRDPSNWTATHRLTGVLFVVAGLALALLAALQPAPAGLLAGLAAALILPVLLGGIYSFIRSRRR